MFANVGAAGSAKELRLRSAAGVLLDGFRWHMHRPSSFTASYCRVVASRVITQLSPLWRKAVARTAPGGMPLGCFSHTFKNSNHKSFNQGARYVSRPLYEWVLLKFIWREACPADGTVPKSGWVCSDHVPISTPEVLFICLSFEPDILLK
jgi:hypothetical protein